MRSLFELFDLIDSFPQDIGWGEKVGPLWRHCFHETNSKAFIFVIDSSDRETIDEAREKLSDAVSMTSNSVIVLVFANKKDIENGKFPFF